MSNVLLVDTNFSSGPILRFLREIGHRVTVIGANPQDALAKSEKEYIEIDYSDLEKTRRLIRDIGIEYIVPGCNDMSYMVCAALNVDGEFPGIDSYSTAQILHQKDKFREFARQHSLPVPKVLREEEIGSRWPVIVKPVDAFSGKGITVLHKHNSAALATALKKASQASRTGTCLVEDYVEGQLYSHSAFIQAGEILIDFIVEEHCTASPFAVDTSRVVHDPSQEITESIRDNIRLLSRELNLQDGLFHTQFISNGSQYWIIEVTRRCPGDMYSYLIESSTGFQYANNYARPFLNLPFDRFGKAIQKEWVMRHTLSSPMEVTLGSITFDFPLKIIKWIPIRSTGDSLLPAPQGRLGVLFVSEPTEQALMETFSNTLKRQLFSITK